MKTKTRFSVDILLTAPMHFTSLRKGSVNLTTGVVDRFGNKAPGDAQAALTISMPVLTQSASGRNPEVPIIPSNSLGGRLRRHAADMLCESICERKVHLSVDAYNTLTSGSAVASPDSAKRSSSLLAAKEHPFFSLFGGTSLMLSSSLVVCDGYPIVQLSANMLLVPPLTSEAVADIPESRLFVPVQIVRKNDAKNMRGITQLETVVGAQALSEYLSAEYDKGVERKENKRAVAAAAANGERVEKGKKDTLEIATAMDAAIPGLTFALRFELTEQSEAQVGLFVLSLQRLLRGGQLGGKAARGMGRFVILQSRVHEADGSGGWTSDTLFAQDDLEITEGTRLHGCVAKASEWLEKADPNVIEAFAAGNEQAIKTLSAKTTAATEDA